MLCHGVLIVTGAEWTLPNRSRMTAMRTTSAVRITTVLLVAMFSATVTVWSVDAQEPVKWFRLYDFYALVGGKTAAAAIIRGGLAFVGDRVQGSTVFVLGPGRSPGNGDWAVWWSEAWLQDSVPLVKLTGPAGQQHALSGSRFLRFMAASSNPQRVRIFFLNQTRHMCDGANGPSVAFDRVAGGWRLDRASEVWEEVKAPSCTSP